MIAMRAEKWLWIITIVNIAIIALLFLVIRATLLALGAFAAYVSGWPVVVLLFLGGTLSVIGIMVGRKTTSRGPRILGFLINGSTLALHSIIILGMIGILIGVQHERFIIPDGYQGDIYVVHGVENGEPEKRAFGQVTYRIPSDGILRTQVPMKRGLTMTTYYYERRDGTLERIRGNWPTTVRKTPENLKNYKDLGVFFPGTGSVLSSSVLSSSAKCSVQFQQFYVGTKAYLLSEYKQKDLGLYLREHPIACGDRAN